MTPRGPWGAPLSLEVILRPMAFIRSTDGASDPSRFYGDCGGHCHCGPGEGTSPRSQGGSVLAEGSWVCLCLTWKIWGPCLLRTMNTDTKNVCL